MASRTGVLLAALLAFSAGCTDNEPTTPSTDPTAGGPSAEQQELAQLARTAAASSFDATYDAVVAGEKGPIRILARPPSYRVDIISSKVTAQFYDIDAGVVSCAVRPGKPSDCVLVAKKGEPVPERFDPGVQHLFKSGPEALSANPQGYAVSALPDAPAAGGLPAGRCFHVERLKDLETVAPGTVTPEGEGFETGDYCFDPATGVLVSAKVTSGTLTLSKLGNPPTAKAFEPPSKPVPLPPGKTTATPSPTPSS